jgi:hypothetical protein
MQKKAVLALLVDGARADVMERMARAGELSAVDRHFVQRGGFATATSVFLTVSGPAHLPLLAGIHPGAANLPGIRWAERPQGKRGWFLGRTRSYMAPLRARKLERDVPASVKTLFAHVPKMADVNTWFVRGCPASARRTRWSKPTAFMRSLLTRDWHRSEDQAEKALLDALDRGFTSVHAVFPAIDELGHRFGPLSEPSFEAYRHFDRALERIVDGLARRKQLDETLIVISSDHGQTATHTHVDIDRIVADVYPKTVCYPKIWRHALSAQAAVMVSGNSMANVYVQVDSPFKHPFAFTSKNADNICSVNYSHLHAQTVPYTQEKAIRPRRNSAKSPPATTTPAASRIPAPNGAGRLRPPAALRTLSIRAGFAGPSSRAHIGASPRVAIAAGPRTGAGRAHFATTGPRRLARPRAPPVNPARGCPTRALARTGCTVCRMAQTPGFAARSPPKERAANPREFAIPCSTIATPRRRSVCPIFRRGGDCGAASATCVAYATCDMNGRCVAKASAGEPCDDVNGPRCLGLLSCDSGSCALPPARVCR